MRSLPVIFLLEEISPKVKTPALTTMKRPQTMTQGDSAHSAVCPLGAVDKRLGDAHLLWHQAERAYFDPDGFRLAVQNTIQTLRTVTFILQKNKRAIPGFEAWYANWQERLRADPLMRWIHDTRNKIEKEGDLEAESLIRAEILASYLDEGPRTEVPAGLFEGVEGLLRRIPDGAIGEHVRRHGVLRIQRRWVENTLPRHELLDALAIGYGKMSEVVYDAHKQIGLDPPLLIHDGGESYDLPAMGWRFPCMIGHDVSRTLQVSLSDGNKIEFERKSTMVPAGRVRAEVGRLMRRYGRNPLEALQRGCNTEEELAAAYFDAARTMFLRDGYHIIILILLRERKPVRQMQINVYNQQEKYVLMRELSHDLTRSGADAALMIGEAWVAAPSDLLPYQRPTDSPARREALTLTLVRKVGAPLDMSAMIIRDGGSVSLEQTRITRGVAPFEFAPFYQAWGRSIPETWVKLSNAVIAVSKRNGTD